MSNALQMRVEELSTRIVLGNMEDVHWSVAVKEIGEEARRDGRGDAAQIADEMLSVLERAANMQDVDAALTEGVVRLQQALLGSNSAGRRPDAEAGVEPSAESSLPFSRLADDPEILGDFIVESHDHLAQVEVEMMRLEKDPDHPEAIHTVFRAFHTIKGLAGFLNLDDIRDVAHETESLLDMARIKTLKVSPAVVDVVLSAADFLKVWLDRLEVVLAGKNPGPAPEKSALLKRIQACAQGGAAPEAEMHGMPAGHGNTPAAEEKRSVRVDTAKLDCLVDMAGEMIVAQTIVRHRLELAALGDPVLLRSLNQFARITGDLQKTAMSMRMVPVGGLFQKMQRLVRDLARKTGKNAELEMIGGGTELDRNMVEELADPLMHMIRNAMDHGLELPDERRAAGKSPTGRIRLQAGHQAGNIVLEIADDGRGLNREKIQEKARRAGLIHDESQMTERELFDLIFAPGFSTADEVTEVSGRGVGMDVVRKQILKLRGSIDIDSHPGKGTSLHLRLPLTLAIIDGLVVGVGNERYVVPLFSVREVLRPAAKMLFTVEERKEMAMVRNSLLPIVRLYRRFDVPPRSKVATDNLLIVVEASGRPFCLMADELIGKQEVVIKSLGANLKDIRGIAGGAILGDGKVGLILDLEGIYHGGCQ